MNGVEKSTDDNGSSLETDGKGCVRKNTNDIHLLYLAV
jgi:hypothetical protein